MEVKDQVIKYQQSIARDQKLLALMKLKKRRLDTRHKIELGGLVIKSGMANFDKTVILTALEEAFFLLSSNSD